MKKAKILVPAMGMMLLSTAAAVSGTMAWFSATRNVEVRTTNFAVQAIDGALTVEAEDVVATTSDNSGAVPQISLGSNKLADASFDFHSSVETLYTDHTDATDKIDSFTSLGTLASATTTPANWAVTGVSNLYYAASFNLTFTYDFKSDTRNLALFFDLKNSNVTNADGSGTGDHTHKGYRMAFIGASRFVWAPNRANTETYDHDSDAETTAIKCGSTYVSKTTPGTGEKYYDCYSQYASGEEFMSDDCTGITMADNAVIGTLSTHEGYLGQIEKGSGATGELTIKVVVWFEGSDPAVINASTMDAVSSNLLFYVRTVTTA